MLINGCACCQIRRDLRDLLCRVRDKGMGDVEGIVIESGLQCVRLVRSWSLT